MPERRKLTPDQIAAYRAAMEALLEEREEIRTKLKNLTLAEIRSPKYEELRAQLREVNAKLTAL